eukprot:gene29334-38412_t
MKVDTKFQQLCNNLTDHLLDYAQSPIKELQECAKETIKLFEIFCQPNLITQPVLDCAGWLLLGRPGNRFLISPTLSVYKKEIGGTLATFKIDSQLPDLIKRMSISQMRETLQSFQSDKDRKEDGSQDDITSAYILLMHISRHAPAASVIEQNISLLLQSSSSHCDVKRMVLPSIIVTVSETLCPALLEEKMKAGILTAFTQVAADRDRTLRNELYPVESTEQVHIYDACCPVFYPANVCMGIGPNIFKQKFDKVEESSESRMRVSMLAASIAVELHTQLSYIETLQRAYLNRELKLLSDTIVITADIAHMLPSGYAWIFISQLQFSPTKKSFVHWLLEDVLSVLDVDTISEFKSTAAENVDKNSNEHHFMVDSHELYSAVLYGLLAVISLEGEPRMLLLEVLLNGMDEIVNPPTATLNEQKSNRDLMYVLCISDFISSSNSFKYSITGPSANVQVPFFVSMEDMIALLAVSGLCELFSNFSPMLMTSGLKFEKTVLNSFLQAHTKLLNDGFTYARTISRYLEDLKVDPEVVDVQLLRFYNVYELSDRYATVKAERDEEKKLTESFSQEILCFDELVGDLIRNIGTKMFKETSAIDCLVNEVVGHVLVDVLLSLESKSGGTISPETHLKEDSSLLDTKTQEESSSENNNVQTNKQLSIDLQRGEGKCSWEGDRNANSDKEDKRSRFLKRIHESLNDDDDGSGSSRSENDSDNSETTPNSEYTIHDSDTDEDDTENESMFGDSFDDDDDNNSAYSQQIDAIPGQKCTNYHQPSVQEVVHGAGMAALKSKNLFLVNQGRFESYNSSPARKPMRSIFSSRMWGMDWNRNVDTVYLWPIANMLSLSAVMQEYPQSKYNDELNVALVAKRLQNRRQLRKLTIPIQSSDLLINPEILKSSLGHGTSHTTALWNKFDSPIDHKPTSFQLLATLTAYLAEKRLNWLSGGNVYKYREMLSSDCRLLHLQRSIDLVYTTKANSWSEMKSKVKFIESVLVRITDSVTNDEQPILEFNMCLLEMVVYQMRKVLSMSKSVSPKKWKKEANIDTVDMDILSLGTKIAQNLLTCFLAVFNSHVASGSQQLEWFSRIVLLLSKLFEAVMHAFPSLAYRAVKSVGYSHLDFSGVAASYTPDIRDIHVVTPILREDGVNVRLFRNSKEKETQLPHVWQALCRILHCLISRPDNCMPILTALSDAAKSVIAEVEAELARDLLSLGQGDGSELMVTASTCYPYRRLLYYVITLSSVTSKIAVEHVRVSKLILLSGGAKDVTKLFEDDGLTAGLTAMSVASATDADMNSKAPLAETVGLCKTDTELAMDTAVVGPSSALLSMPIDAPDLREERLQRPVYSSIEKLSDQDTTGLSVSQDSFMPSSTKVSHEVFKSQLQETQEKLASFTDQMARDELTKIESVKTALARALQPIRKSACWMDLLKVFRTINGPANQSGSPRPHHLRDSNGIRVLFEDFIPNPIEVVEETKISDRKVDLTAPEQMIIMETPRKGSPRATLPYDGYKTPRNLDVKHSKEFDKTVLGYPQDDESGSHVILEALSLFVDENSKYVNEKVKQTPRLLDFEYRSLILVPDLSKQLDLAVKRKYLKLLITRLKRPMKYSDMDESSREVELNYAKQAGLLDTDESVDDDAEEEDEPEALSIRINRDQVLEQSFHALSEVSPRYLLRCTTDIVFCGEEGIDSGGLTREWYSLLTRSLFAPSYMLFTLTSDGVTYQPHPQSKVNPEHVEYFRFTGRLIAKAICDGQLMDVHFSLPISFSDLAVLDPAFHKSLSSLLHYSLNDLGLGSDGGLTFTVETTHFGKQYYEDLVPDGSQVLVTDENKQEYVRLLAHHRLVLACKTQMDSLMRGFNEILPAATFLHFFDPSELELMISGLPEVDIEDMRANTTYSGYASTDATIGHFWTVLRSFTAEEKALFVQFVTGSSKVPLDGFKSLKGTEGEVQRISVHKAFNVALLPTAHTCFNQLDLPEYTSVEELREKLLLAIRHGAEGFGMN